MATPPQLLAFIAVMTMFHSAHSQIKYPIPRKENFDTTIYNQKLVDPYFWMSRKENEEEMLAFSRAQTDLSRSMLDSIPGTETIMEDWAASYSNLDDELWKLQTVRNNIYYSRYIPGEGSWICRRTSVDAPEEKILKNVQINGQKYTIKKRQYAYNKPLLAMMLSQNGESNPQIRIYDMDKKEFLPDSLGRVMFNDSRGVSMAWLPDDSGLMYTQAPPSEIKSEIYFNGKIKLHILGTDPIKDEEIFGKGVNPKISLKDYETPYVYSFNNSPYILARIRAGDADNYAFAVHYSKINGKNTPWKKLENYINLGDGFDANGKFLFAGTKTSPKYEVVKINMDTGESPSIFLPQQKDALAITDVGNSSGIVAGKNALYVLVRRIGDMQILKIDYKTLRSSFLPLKYKGSILELTLLREDDLVFAMGSAVRGIQYLHYNFSADSLAPLPFAEKVFDASGIYYSEVIEVPSRDGKLIPVSLVYKKELSLQKEQPLIIEAYGNSGQSTDLFYDPNLVPWLKNGGIYAYAHVRGGGELGNTWIADGQFPNKINSINDVVDVAAFFVEQGYTSADKQIVMGGSAGSFLVGMSVNQRPDLFAAGLFLAGLPDIVTNRDAAHARESKSVGSLETKEGFLSSLSISSYYQIPPNKKLPAMFISHGATDYILSMHPSARYTAKMQEMQKGERPILFFVDWESGHNGSDLEMLYMYKFAFWQTGHPDFQPR